MTGAHTRNEYMNIVRNHAGIQLVMEKHRTKRLGLLMTSRLPAVHVIISLGPTGIRYILYTAGLRL